MEFDGRTPATNTGLAKVAVQCSADTFVVNQSLVLRINICGENRHLRQAANRYHQCLKTDTLNIKRLTKMPTHIQAHLVAQTHGRPLRNQKSLNFCHPSTIKFKFV